MESASSLLREMRLGAGLSQRALAERAGTSQPAIARYERGAAAPSLQTLARLTRACGRRLMLSAEIPPDPRDVELAEALLDLEPLERLQALQRYGRLRTLVQEER